MGSGAWIRRSTTGLTAAALVTLGLGTVAPSAGAAGTPNTWAAWPVSTPGASSPGLAAAAPAVIVDGTDVYVGTGLTNSSCGTAAGNVCKWDGTTWTTVGTADGTNGIEAMAVRPGTHKLYVGGTFAAMRVDPLASGGPDNVGMYDGSWHALGADPTGYCGTTGATTALSFTDADHLLAAFYEYGATSVCSIDLSTGSPSWVRLASAAGSRVNDIVATSPSEVYLGGSFASVSSIQSSTATTASRVVKGSLSGSVWTWSALGTGVNEGADGTVRALAASDSSHVYLGGDFANVAGVACTGVAMWTGSTATCVGGGFDGPAVYDLNVAGNSVYAVGSLSRNGTAPDIRKAAYFDGSAWVGMGFGLGGPASAVSRRADGNAVVVGSFTTYKTDATTGTAAANYIAEWTPPVSVPGAPTSVTATAADAQASVSWTAPASNGGATIDSYTVTSSPGANTCTTTGSPAGASCTVSGLTNGTSYTFSVTATNTVGTGPASAASSGVTPAASGGGGGGGGSTTPSTDTPSPSPTSTPTTPPTPLTPDPLGPQDGPPLTPGGTTVTTGGQPTPVTTVPNKTGGTVTSSGDDWSLTTGGRTPAGKSQPTSPTGVVQVPQGGSLVVSGKGYEPGTSVQVYAMNPALLLGTFTVGADGTFRDSVTWPAGLGTGAGVLQVNGFSTSGAVRSYSLGLGVIKDASGKVHTVTKTVYFAAGSSWLSPNAKSTLADAVKSVPKGAKSVSVVCTGYVQGTSDTSNDFTLSTARATKVAAQMKADKLAGKYYVTGRGQAQQTGASARRVQVIVTYAVPASNARR